MKPGTKARCIVCDGPWYQCVCDQAKKQKEQIKNEDIGFISCHVPGWMWVEVKDNDSIDDPDYGF